MFHKVLRKMPSPRRRHRSSSSTSSSYERRKHRAKRVHSCRIRHVSSSFRRRSPLSDFEDFQRRRYKYSPLRSRRRSREALCCKRRTRSPYSSESDDYKHHRHSTSRTRHYSPRKYCPRRKRISFSPDYRNYHHHRRPVLAIQDRSFSNIDSDIEILEEKRPKKKCSTSSSKDRSNTYRWYEKSGKYLEENKLKRALKCINIALEECNKNEDKLLSKIYSRRGTIYSLLEKPKCSFQAFLDWEHAYIIDKENMESRMNMSKVLFMGSNKLYRKKAYSEALIPLKHALELNKNNGEASILLKLIQKKLVEEIKRKEITTEKTPCVVSNSSTETNLEKALDIKYPPYSKHDMSVFVEIQRLNKLAGNALEENNYPRAIIYINKALKLHKDIPGDFVFRQLSDLKEAILNNVTRCPEILSD